MGFHFPKCSLSHSVSLSYFCLLAHSPAYFLEFSFGPDSAHRSPLDLKQCLTNLLYFTYFRPLTVEVVGGT